MSRSNYQFKENTFESVVPQVSLQYTQSTIQECGKDSNDLIIQFEMNFEALQKELLRCLPDMLSQMIQDVLGKINILKEQFVQQSKEKAELLLYVRSQVRSYMQSTQTIIQQNHNLKRQKEEMEQSIVKLTQDLESSEIKYVIDLILEKVSHQCEMNKLVVGHQKCLTILEQEHQILQQKCVEQESDEKACKFFEKGKSRFGGVSTATGSQFLQSQSFHQRFMQMYHTNGEQVEGNNESQLSILDINHDSNQKTKFALKSLSFAPNFETNPESNSKALRSTSTPQRMDYSLNEMQTQFKLLRRQKESVKRSINQWQEEFLSKEGRPPTPKDKDSIGNFFQRYATLQAQADRLEQEIKGRQMNQNKTQEVSVQVEFSKLDIQEMEVKLMQVNLELKKKHQINLEMSLKLKDSIAVNKSLKEQIHQHNITLTQLNSQVDLQNVALSQKNKDLKELTNQVEDFKGKVRVFCRVRPLLEKESNQSCAIQVQDELTLHLNHKLLKKTYKFDSCYDQKSTQENIFQDVKPLIQQAYDGFNVCIFAYGQTGSGKTYTMYGTHDNPGMVPRLADELFSIIQKNQSTHECSVYCYITELYKDQIVDLLGQKTQLEVREDARGFTYIQNVTTVQIVSKSDLLESIDYAVSHRKTSTTEMNEQSSRSHLIVTICLENYSKVNKKRTITKICLIDLAGSERINKSNPTPSQLNETKSINKSLTALGDVITALVSSQDHIPYRNSKLTHLMKDCLGGNSKTIMIINISPGDYNIDETQMALIYAQRVKNIKNDPVKNNETIEMSKIKEICKKLQQENDMLKQEDSNKRENCLPLQQTNKRF